MLGPAIRGDIIIENVSHEHPTDICEEHPEAVSLLINKNYHN